MGESWTIKKAEHWRIYAFELWCRRRLLRVPWTLRKSNQSILKEINPKYSLEELTPTLKTPTLATWWEKPTHWKRPWRERLKAEGDDRGWDGWIASPTQWTWAWASLRRWWGIRRPGWCAAVHGVANRQTCLRDWTTSRILRSKGIMRLFVCFRVTFLKIIKWICAYCWRLGKYKIKAKYKSYSQSHGHCTGPQTKLSLVPFH